MQNNCFNIPEITFSYCAKPFLSSGIPYLQFNPNIINLVEYIHKINANSRNCIFLESIITQSINY